MLHFTDTFLQQWEKVTDRGLQIIEQMPGNICIDILEF